MTPPVEKERAAITPAHDFALAFGLECEKTPRTPEGLAWLISIVEARDEQIRQASRAELSKGEQSAEELVEGLGIARTVRKLKRDWQKGQKCPGCKVGAYRYKCAFEMGGDCPRHDPENYDNQDALYEEVENPKFAEAVALITQDRARALAEQREENQRLRETLRSLDLTCNFGWTNKAFTCETSENDPSTWCARCKARAALSPTNGRKS